MDYRFNAEEWRKLTPAQRVRKCRLLADEAKALGNASSDILKKHYLSIAKDWLELAAEIEQNMMLSHLSPSH